MVSIKEIKSRLFPENESHLAIFGLSMPEIHAIIQSALFRLELSGRQLHGFACDTRILRLLLALQIIKLVLNN